MHQIPIGFLAVLGFLIGLVVSFWVAGVFGFPAPLFWAAVSIVFTVGVFLLQRPKIFLVVTFLYYGLFLNGMLFGIFYVPIPFARLLDELMLAVPLAYIVMRSINRSLPKKATFFPFFYLLFALISYKANDVPKLVWVRAVLSYAKFYIYWYFARSLGPWSLAEKKRWFGLLLAFGLAQCFANFIWQRNVVLTVHPDASIGTLGNAHLAGYVSAFTIFYLAGWFIAGQFGGGLVKRFWGAVALALLAYNFIFLTDTKHGLILFPLASVPFFFSRLIPIRTRGLVALGLLVFGVLSWLYLAYGPYTFRASMRDYIDLLRWSGKGRLYKVALNELPRSYPYMFVLGAGPGNFCSTAATYAFRPLAQKYVIPYIILGMRSGGAAAEASVLGNPTSSAIVLIGEYGWLGALNYFGFWLWALWNLWKKNMQNSADRFEVGQRIALCACLIFLLLQSTLSDILGFGQLVMPIWSLVGMYWDGPAQDLPPLPKWSSARSP